MNPAFVTIGGKTETEGVMLNVKEAELEEMWSFVGSKKQPRWLWEALEHQTGQILAYVFGRHEDRAFLKLKALHAPFGMRRFYADRWRLIRGICLPTSMESANVQLNHWNGNI